MKPLLPEPSSSPARAARRKAEPEKLKLGRNFLHAAQLEFPHPKTGKLLQLEAHLPAELEAFLARLDGGETEAGAQPSKH